MNQHILRRGGAIGWVLLGVGLAGCGEPAHMQDLYNRVLQSYTSSSPDRLYYIGSDNSFDYYYLQKEDQKYKVSQSESVRQDRMNLTGDRSKWKVVSPTADVISTEYNL
jgi:hypothetical protein